jgi:hypothetical protein
MGFFCAKRNPPKWVQGFWSRTDLPEEQISGQVKLYTPPLKIGSRQDQQNINTKTTGNHAAAGFLPNVND